PRTAISRAVKRTSHKPPETRSCFSIPLSVQPHTAFSLANGRCGHSCPNYEMRFATEAGLMRVSWDSLFGNLFRACPSPFGRGWREAPSEGRKCTLIRPFGPPSPRGRRTRTSISANLDTTALPLGEVPKGSETGKLQA